MKNDAKPANDVSTFQELVRYYVKYTLGKSWEQASKNDIYKAVSFAVREKLVDGMLDTEARYKQADAKRIYYLSMEFLMGRSLGNNLYNLKANELAQDALTAMGYDLEEIRDTERS